MKIILVLLDNNCFSTLLKAKLEIFYLMDRLIIKSLLFMQKIIVAYQQKKVFQVFLLCLGDEA